MYSTCLFCNTALGANESIEHFPVGRRLAFDGAKGRLWVICTQCGRWNLSAFDERLEAIEECERAFRATFVRVSTDNVGFARLNSGAELVRIGSPLRPEFAAWRYGRQFQRRYKRAQVAGMVGAVGAVSAIVAGAALIPVTSALLGMGALSILLLPAATLAGAIPYVGATVMRDYEQHDRVVARFAQKHTVLTVREQHLSSIELNAGRDGSVTSLVVPHDLGRKQFDGTEATHAMSVILAGSNREGADESRVQSAVRQIEESGDAEGFVADASRRNHWRSGRVVSLLNDVRELGALHLSPVERLALEMSVHEETERRAMHGELAVLEAAWRDAEVIARIADTELTPLG